MWISKEEYEFLKEKAKKTIDAEAQIELQRHRDRDMLKWTLEDLAKKANRVPELEAELESYKQKYADEVQKRLVLIEQFGDVQAV